MGTLFQIVLSFAKGIVGVVALAIAIEGYFRGNISIIERMLYFISSLAILTPNNVQVNVIGLTIFLALILIKLIHRLKY